MVSSLDGGQVCTAPSTVQWLLLPALLRVLVSLTPELLSVRGEGQDRRAGCACRLFWAGAGWEAWLPLSQLSSTGAAQAYAYAWPGIGATHLAGWSDLTFAFRYDKTDPCLCCVWRVTSSGTSLSVWCESRLTLTHIRRCDRFSFCQVSFNKWGFYLKNCVALRISGFLPLLQAGKTEFKCAVCSRRSCKSGWGLVRLLFSAAHNEFLLKGSSDLCALHTMLHIQQGCVCFLSVERINISFSSHFVYFSILEERFCKV